VEALHHDEEALSLGKRSNLCKRSWEETQKALDEAARRARGAQRKKILKLLCYLEENWSGIKSITRCKAPRHD